MTASRASRIAAALASTLIGPVLLAPAMAQDDKAIEACHNKGSDPDIVSCLDNLTNQWDRKLNLAYQEALKNAEPAGVAPLRASERAWLEYRKQRCYAVSAVEGTIARILGPDCFLRMTKARAEELHGDAQGLAGPAEK